MLITLQRSFFSAPSIKLGFELERTQSISEFITLCEEKADNVVIDYVRTWIG
ncbi:hypothetical protein KUL17_14760 [Alteromonas sp. KUL17]|nr:hypothetical protein KUL17_14760 [Alteromonas sp. KUL17]